MERRTFHGMATDPLKVLHFHVVFAGSHCTSLQASNNDVQATLNHSSDDGFRVSEPLRRYLLHVLLALHRLDLGEPRTASAVTRVCGRNFSPRAVPTYLLTSLCALETHVSAVGMNSWQGTEDLEPVAW